MQKFFLFFLILTTSFVSTFSQEKFEKEYRIKETQVPESSRQMLNKWNLKSNIKWYAEESQDGKTIEAKLKHNGYKYSIEFSEKGDLIDVEKTIHFSELPLTIKQSIRTSLSKKFQKFKIKKVQVQFSGGENRIYKQVFKPIFHSEKTTILYELIVKGKIEKENSRFEILMNANGEIVKELKFKSGNFLNLEF